MAIETKPGAVPQPGQPNQPAQSQTSQPRPAAQPAEQPRQGNSPEEPGEGIREALEAQHKARTEVPGHPGIDARLDNRAGAFRPPLEEWPAKPQQVDGPDLPGQLEHTRKVLRELGSADIGPTKGAYSPGPHGLSDESQRGGQAVEGSEGWKD